MKPPFLMAVAALVAIGCNTGGGPTPTPPPAPTVRTPSEVYGVLSDAGCYRSDAGVYFVTLEGQMAHPPAWYGCLVEGGTVSGCGVPCSPPGSP